MREHPLTASPLSAFPHDRSLDPDVDFARRPYDPSQMFPSSLGIGGRVGWSRFRAIDNGHIRIKYRYDQVDWDSLRRDHGWAAAQYQVVLRTNLDVPDLGHERTPIRIELTQGIEYALIPTDRDTEGATVWYQGDVYNFAATPTGSRDTNGLSNFARSISVIPGRYIVVVRAMYEIRMFGDPGPGNAPTIDMCLRVEVDDIPDIAEVVSGLRVVPDVVDRRTMGDWISVPLRIKDGLEGPVVLNGAEGLVQGCGGDPAVKLVEPGIKLHPGQTRPIAFWIIQIPEMDDYSDDGHLPSIQVKFDLEHKGHRFQLVWRHQFKQHEMFKRKPFLMTFSSPSGIDWNDRSPPALVSSAVLVPPRERAVDYGNVPPVILGLHGAGVDVESTFWQSAFPDYPGLWAILPTGKNEWGEDWHGGSMTDAWAARSVALEVGVRVGIGLQDTTLWVFIFTPLRRLCASSHR